METPGLSASFLAGVLLFFSPCIAPVIPAFLASISGTGLRSLDELHGSSRLQVLMNAITFILGFSVMFIALGSTLGYLGSLIPNFQTWVNRVGGVVIIVLALQMLGLINLPFISQSMQAQSVKTRRSGSFSSVLMGASFGLSWTPCTGPILAGILALSVSTASMAQAAVLMTAFSAGLAVPFLVTGFFTAAVSKFLRSAPKLIGAIHMVAGVLLLAMGVLVFTGRVQWLIGTVVG